MINLIPKEEKKKMAIDFHYRLATLFLLTLSFCVLVASISILPAYFMSSVKNDLVGVRLEAQKSQPLPVLGDKSLAAVEDVNSKLDLVERSEGNKFPVSLKVINAIILKKRPDIKITQIVYNNDGIQGKKINITGTAPSRPILLLFRQALEDSPNFKSVDLPISNFVKGSNIQFSLSLIPS